jgi:hypothetical protein
MKRFIILFLVLFIIICVVAKGQNSVATSSSTLKTTPIIKVIPDLNHLQKWDDSNGDTADPFWADDNNLYHFNCDGRGFGTQPRNFCFNKLMGTDLLSLKGSLVNQMDEYGKAGEMEKDSSNWKVTGQECIDGVFYGFVVCNLYGNKSKDPLMRQTSYNASLIKSTDRGLTWNRSEKENYNSPMWPGSRFGAPCFIHYGMNGGFVKNDNADKFVYVLSNNGFWNGGDDFILARIKRVDLPKLSTADWMYYCGGNGLQDNSWTGDIGKAIPILSHSAKLGWTAPAFIPSINRYLVVSWHITPTLKKWFEPGLITYDFYEAEHPWGPWSFVSSFNDSFLVEGHMYGPNLCAKYQERNGDDVKIELFTSGCPFEDKPNGLYKMWRIPLILKTKPLPQVSMINDNDPAIRYSGNWQVSIKNGFHYYQDDIHYSKMPGDSVEYTFTGTGIELLSEKFNDHGDIDIFIDGQPSGSANLKVVNFPRLTQISVFSLQGMSKAQHTITIVNKSLDYVTIDAFKISQ